MKIRLATKKDLPEIITIFESARAFMRENGNQEQWNGIYPGEADILAVLDATQTEVALPVLKADGKLITPDSIPLDQLKNPKALNTMILGALSASLPQLPEEAFIAAINNAFPEKLRALNIEMFQLGRNSGK